MKFIWATRGKFWGFRLIKWPEGVDPFSEYENMFNQVGPNDELFFDSGDAAGVRVFDPLARCDQFGRLILHEFVIYEPDQFGVRSLETFWNIVWPEVSREYDAMWDLPELSVK